MRKKKAPNPKRTMHLAIVLGIIVIGITIFVTYYLEQSTISGQRFGDQLAQIQTDLKNETQSFDQNFTEYKNGQISKDQMLAITDRHIVTIQNVIPRYDELKPPEIFGPSLQLFRLSTQTQIESDKALKDWIQTGENSSKARSDELLQQSFQYEMNALQSYNSAKSKGSQ